MANFIFLATCASLVVLSSLKIIHGQPISKEDVESLLPNSPETKNETIAAIVQDPVVQDAVHSIVGDGTLSGLVVKKNTVILPATEPEVVLSHKEQILAAPLSALENIRKNITKAVIVKSENEKSDITEINEFTVAEIIPLDNKTDPDSIKSTEVPDIPTKEEEAENDAEKFSLKSPAQEPVSEELEVPKIEESSVKILEEIIPETLGITGSIDYEITAPVGEILQPKYITEYRESVVDALPETSTKISGITNAVVSDDNKLEKNIGTKNEEILEYGSRIPVAVITSEELNRPAVKIETKTAVAVHADEFPNTEDVLAVFTVGDENIYYQSDKNDMITAEDIIFRPLFRYHQQQNDRTRVLENREFRRTNYRRYRPNYSNDYSSGYNYYKKPHRTRYYEDNY